MLNINDVLEILSTPLLGIVPESQAVLRASNLGSPVTLNEPNNVAAKAYVEAARRLQGETVALELPTEKRGLLDPTAGKEGGMILFDFFKRRANRSRRARTAAAPARL